MIKRFDTFQLQGFRKMLRQLTTFGQMQIGQTRTNRNSNIYEDIDHWYRYNNPTAAPIEPLSKNYQHQKYSALVKLILLPMQYPRKAVVFSTENYDPHFHCKKRDGRPRKNLLYYTLE